MIRMKNGELKLKGTPPELMAEFTQIASGLKKAFEKNGLPAEVAKRAVDEAYGNAFLSADELKIKAENLLKEVLLKEVLLKEALLKFTEEGADDE